MAKPLYTCIVFMQDGSSPRKYRNISNKNNFFNFCITIKANYFNVYDKVSKQYVERVYIKKGV